MHFSLFDSTLCRSNAQLSIDMSNGFFCHVFLWTNWSKSRDAFSRDEIQLSLLLIARVKESALLQRRFSQNLSWKYRNTSGEINTPHRSHTCIANRRVCVAAWDVFFERPTSIWKSSPTFGTFQSGFTQQLCVSCHIFCCACTHENEKRVYKKCFTYQRRVDASDDRDAQVGRRPGNLNVTYFTLQHW